MTTENILQSIGTTGGIKFFPGTYVPTNNSRYSLIYNNFYNMAFTIDSIDILDDIVVVGISSIQTVYVYKISQNILNLIQTITPRSSSLTGTQLFGKVVKIANTGIFVSDPSYGSNGAVFVYFCTQIGLSSWYQSAVKIIPSVGVNVVGINFGSDICINNSMIFVTSYIDNTTTCFKYIYDYSRKFIKQDNNISLPSADNTLFPYRIMFLNNSNIILNEKITNSDNTYQNSLIIYTTDLVQNSIISNDNNKIFDYFTTFNNYVLTNNKHVSSSTDDSGNTIDITDDSISLYTLIGSTVNLKDTFNSKSINIDTNTDDIGIVYMDNNFIIWNIENSNKVYIAEISEMGNIIPSSVSMIDVENLISIISIMKHSNGIIFTGYNSNNMTVLVTYNLNLI